jgi:transglutaminase-like putative cysteine protease
LTAVRVSQIDSRKTFLKALPLIFLVWVVALTASTHVAALVYFALSAALWWWAGMEIHLMGLVEPEVRPLGMVSPRHAAAASVAALILAVPVFFAVPRLHAPWVAGRGGVQNVTGFSTRVELSGVGSIRESQQRAMVVQSASGDSIRPEWMKLRATAYERVTVGSWAPRSADRGAEPRVGLVWVGTGGGDLGDAAQLEVLLDRPREYLFLPEGALAVDVERPIRLGPAGGVELVGSDREPLHYTVWVARQGSVPHMDPPPDGGRDFKVAPDVKALAERVTAGVVNTEDRAAAIEAHLRTEFTYSMAGMRRIGPDPMSWFLLRSRSGHCEYFAGGMVVLLRSIGVPARMVGGYSGGTLSPAGDEVVVREANAHTWVEVWLGEGHGWRVFDPTPAVNVPSLSTVSARERLRFAWEWIQSSWDRYILTFGVDEQIEVLSAVVEKLLGALANLRWQTLVWALAAIAAAWLIWATVRKYGRRSAVSGPPQSRTPAALAIRRLARRLEREGVVVPIGATVRWVGRAARFQWPAAAQPASDLVWLAERELYAPKGSTYGATEVRRVWSDIRRAIRNS